MSHEKEILTVQDSKSIPVNDSLLEIKPTIVLEANGMFPEISVDAETERRIEQIKNTVNFEKLNAPVYFGEEPMRRYGEQLKRSLDGLKARDTGSLAGEMLADLKNKLGSLRLEQARKEALQGKDSSVFGNLPVVGKYFSAFSHMRAMSQDIIKYLEKIEKEADINIEKLRCSIDVEEERFRSTEQAIDDIALYLVAGKMIHEGLKQDYYKKRDEFANSKDSRKHIYLRDMVDFIDNFAQNLLELRISYEDAVQDIPNIRLGQKSALSSIRNQMVTINHRVPSIASTIRTICTFNQVAKSENDSKQANDFDIKMRKIQNKLVADGSKASIISQNNRAEKIQLLVESAEQQITLLSELESMKNSNRIQVQKDTDKIEHIHTKWINAMRAISEKTIEI